MTVLGPVAAEALGRTMCHEHVFFVTPYFAPAEDDPTGEWAEAPITIERLWWLRSHPMNNRHNLRQTDVELAVAEVGQFKQAGGGTLVDVSTVGVGPNPSGLVEVSRRTGVHLVAGTGFYIAQSLPEWVHEAPVEQLAAHMRRELTEGMAGTTARAGLIGELGVTNPPQPVELRVLRAAALVQRELDCAVTIHTGWGADGARLTARVVEEAGLNPARTALSHLDNRFSAEVAGYREIAARGFYLSLDCFGRECYYRHVDTQCPSDDERIRAVLGLLDAGLARQIMVAQDICFRHELVAYGGHGYAHVLRTLFPRLQRRGVDPAALEGLVVANPRRWLTGG
jgi:phosphotriesterase-related protein